MSRVMVRIVWLAAAALSTCWACTRARESNREAGALTPPPAGEWFVDRAKETGLDFVHFNGMSGAQYYAEHMGPGVALLDYDNDGDLDVFVPQGQMLGSGRKL